MKPQISTEISTEFRCAAVASQMQKLVWHVDKWVTAAVSCHNRHNLRATQTFNLEWVGRKLKCRSKIDLKLRLRWAQDWSQHLDVFPSKFFIYCVTSSHHLPIRYQISAVLNAITIITPHLCCQDPFGCLTCSALVCHQDCWCGDTTGWFSSRFVMTGSRQAQTKRAHFKISRNDSKSTAVVNEPWFEVTSSVWTNAEWAVVHGETTPAAEARWVFQNCVGVFVQFDLFKCVPCSSFLASKCFRRVWQKLQPALGVLCFCFVCFQDVAINCMDGASCLASGAHVSLTLSFRVKVLVRR